jgi:RNA polymerase sigma-70 factor (ECF subfamily)
MGPAAVDSDFDEFFRANYRRVVDTVRSTVGAQAEDVAQEAFIVAEQRWHELALYDVPYAWVRKVALRIARRHAARERMRPLIEARLRPREPPFIADTTNLVGALGGMPAREAAAVWLHHIEDRPLTDVADALMCTHGAAKVLLVRARRALGERLIGFDGRWVSETSWTPDMIVRHLRQIAAAEHVDAVVEQDLDGRGGRWELSVAHGLYTLFRDDGFRLDVGTYRLVGDSVELRPALAPGRIMLQWALDAGQLRARFVDSTTTPPHLGVPDRVWWSLYADSGPFRYIGQAKSTI